MDNSWQFVFKKTRSVNLNCRYKITFVLYMCKSTT